MLALKKGKTKKTKKSGFTFFAEKKEYKKKGNNCLFLKPLKKRWKQEIKCVLA